MEGIRRIAGGWGAVGAVFLLVGCNQPPGPLEARCLEALAYRSPDHGEVESTEAEPTEDGTIVTIRYRVDDEDPASPRHRYVLCGFAIGDRWVLQQMVHEGQPLPETDLALVNSDLLLQDLTAHPERFEERAHRLPPPAPAAAPPASDAPPAAAQAAVPREASAPLNPGHSAASAQPAIPSSPAPAGSGDPRGTAAVPPPAAPAAAQIPAPSSGGSD